MATIRPKARRQAQLFLRFTQPVMLPGTTFIVALLLLGNWACGSKTPTESNARPLQFTPGSGPIEGDRLVFIDVDEPAAAIGSASMACR
ncbi:MAG TPA: hypothetical protein VFZ07_06530, partial [Dongiaceae bacterium]